jgi:hypothetical protein
MTSSPNPYMPPVDVPRDPYTTAAADAWSWRWPVAMTDKRSAGHLLQFECCRRVAFRDNKVRRLPVVRNAILCRTNPEAACIKGLRVQ